jgi:exodeoxyribonuclease VIII
MEAITIDREFLQGRPLSYSALKHFMVSPAHYVKYLTEPREEKPEYAVGSVFEAMLFQENLTKDFVQYEKPNLRSVAGKEEWEKIKDSAKGKTLVTKEQMDIATAMVARANENPEVMRYVNATTRKSRKLTWTDKKTGIPLIGYTDGEADLFDEEWIIEIKTTRSGDPDQFPRDFYNFKYHIQAAMYVEGFYKTMYKFPYYAVLTFDTSQPYNSNVFMFEGKSIDEAKEELRSTLDAFSFCLENNLFHQGYEFKLQTRDYFALRKPGYYKSAY